jgi:hypothetical protein
MEELDQGFLYPLKKHPETHISLSGIKARPPASQSGTLPKSYQAIILTIQDLCTLNIKSNQIPYFPFHRSIDTGYI